MSESISPSRQSLDDALALSTEILRDLESGSSSLSTIALKVRRLASLLNDSLARKIIGCELIGYPTTTTSMSPEYWDLAVKAGRLIEFRDGATGKPRNYVYIESIGELERQLSLAQSLLSSGRKPDEIVASADLLNQLCSRTGHYKPNYSVSRIIANASKRLEGRRARLHDYVSRKYHELRFSTITGDVFSRIRVLVDASIGKYVPGAIEKFSSIHDNLLSNNREDWSNAVHSCRRILKDLADKLFPPREEERVKKIDHETIKIKLGEAQYINRLITFVDEKSGSQRFQEVVGSHLQYLGNRLDSICKGSHKGTHSTIIDREEADRIVVYTYMIVGDLLSLIEGSSDSK